MNQQIIDYIKQSRASGMEDSAIKQALLGAGFPANEIEDAIMGKVSDSDALENILNKKPMFPETKAGAGGKSSLLRKLIKVLVVFVVLLVVVIGGYFAVVNYLPQYAKYVQPYLGPVLDPVFEGVGLPTGVEPVPTPTPTPIPTPTPTPVPTVDMMRDSDGDGLSDYNENIYKTDPTKPDTDGDGYPDGEEVQNGYNPLGPGRAVTTPAPTPTPTMSVPR